MPEDKKINKENVAKKTDEGISAPKVKESRSIDATGDFHVTSEDLKINPELGRWVQIGMKIKEGRSLNEIYDKVKILETNHDVLEELAIKIKPPSVFPYLDDENASDMNILTKQCIGAYSRSIKPLMFNSKNNKN